MSKCPAGRSRRTWTDLSASIRPEHLNLFSDSGHGSETLEGKILSRSHLGDSALFEIEARSVNLKVKLPGDYDFAVGDRTVVVLASGHWRVYSSSSHGSQAKKG